MHFSLVALQLPGSILVTPTSLEFVDLRAKVLPTEFLGIRTVKRDQLEQQQQVSCPSSRQGPCRGGQAGESAQLWQKPCLPAQNAKPSNRHTCVISSWPAAEAEVLVEAADGRRELGPLDGAVIHDTAWEC